ncbi:hypothetical protein GIB67_025765 [Kingdonia uniflora]|uniref:RNase H type-1 domain-containing protein n=1 Tax=Kingdonia uniflora TaxID=39325 RepID=A0A7J7L2R7_9MAGN|nr:hypothetical protein GIB67_025765 [Kingdonia uniflora]
MVGSGAVFRVYNGEVIDVLTKKIVVQISYCAECSNILSSLFSIHEHGWTKIYLVSDSQTTIKAFQHNNVPWKLQASWNLFHLKCR